MPLFDSIKSNLKDIQNKIIKPFCAKGNFLILGFKNIKYEQQNAHFNGNYAVCDI
ncbi:hypothetical protein DOY81_002283 [Sarcophaga bullata]|nr:hypothetical protein DOY81_002283 [Sarcophaga bullata]